MDKAKFLHNLCKISDDDKINSENLDRCVDFYSYIDIFYYFINDLCIRNKINHKKIIIEPIDCKLYDSNIGVQFKIHIDKHIKLSYTDLMNGHQISLDNINGSYIVSIKK